VPDWLEPVPGTESSPLQLYRFCTEALSPLPDCMRRALIPPRFLEAASRLDCVNDLFVILSVRPETKHEPSSQSVSCRKFARYGLGPQGSVWSLATGSGDCRGAELRNRNSPPSRSSVPRTCRPFCRPGRSAFTPRAVLPAASPFPTDGPTWQAMRLSRNRRWGHPDLIRLVEKLSREAAARMAGPACWSAT
jgi:hypothetical protein